MSAQGDEFQSKNIFRQLSEKKSNLKKAAVAGTINAAASGSSFLESIQ